MLGRIGCMPLQPKPVAPATEPELEQAYFAFNDESDDSGFD
jgi:hypothetical protein